MGAGVGLVVPWAWRALAVVFCLAALAASAGCGDDGGPEGRDDPPASAGSGSSAAPGEPLMGGLTVPSETSLVGATFERPGVDGLAERDTLAVLTIEGDPFAAWDDLAAEARGLGLPLPGSGVCEWAPGPQEQAGPVQSPVPVSSPRPDGFDTLSCSASAYAGQAGGVRSLIAQLGASPEGAELGVEMAVDPERADLSPEPRSWPEADPGPAPQSARADAPEVQPARLPAVGEPFGQENNCFEAGYDRLRVPAGARLLGGGTARILDDFAAVLAVDDPRAALDDLATQLDPTGPATGDAEIDIRQVDSPGGRIWQLSGSVSAGGGSCWVTSTPDGALLLVTTHSD